MHELDLDKIIRCLVQVAEVFNSNPEEALIALRDMSFMIDNQIPYRDGHSQRVSNYSLETGKHLKLLGEEMVILEVSALLHDFGKIGVDEEILLRPHALDPREKTEVQMHVLRGYHILSGFAEFEEVLKGVRTHHERYDGHGYPAGLIGSDIPLNGRIIAVADAFDAITSERPYRRARTIKQAIRELQEFSGKQFDPRIVEVFLKFLDS